MKTIISGSRSITSIDVVKKAILNSGFTITEVVSGTANGVDRLGEYWAKSHGIPVKRFPAKWDTYGKRAGFIRNVEMANYATQAIIIWDGESRGSKHMLGVCKQQNIPYFLFTV